MIIEARTPYPRHRDSRVYRLVEIDGRVPVYEIVSHTEPVVVVNT